MAQPPTSARKPRAEDPLSPRKLVTKSGQILASVQPPKLGRPYKDEEEKRQVYQALAYLKSAGKTNRECAIELEVSERTINNYLADELYIEIQHELQADAKEMGHTTIALLIDDALGKLVELMHGSASEFVRFKAAEKILDVAGYNMPREEAHKDSREDVTRFLELVRQRTNVNVQVNIDGSGQLTREPEVKVVEAPREDDEEKKLLSSLSSHKEIPPGLEEYYVQVLPGGRLPD